MGRAALRLRPARFTPERLLADARERFGGFDGVVLWHAYPVIGIDDRNQWDFYRDVPGLPELVADLQDAGVTVFVDYNPGTPAPGGAGATRPNWRRWSPNSARTGSSWTR